MFASPPAMPRSNCAAAAGAPIPVAATASDSPLSPRTAINGVSNSASPPSTGGGASVMPDISPRRPPPNARPIVNVQATTLPSRSPTTNAAAPGCAGSAASGRAVATGVCRDAVASAISARARNSESPTSAGLPRSA